MVNVTTKQICIGCGVCAGVCPTNHLQMITNDFGEYRPRGGTPPCTDCDLCLAVCPFEKGPNEDVLGRELYSAIEGVQYRSETGYFLCNYVGGVSNDALRWSRTSGGLATWMLARLMETGVVDRAICVASTPDPEQLFTFAEFSTVESLWTAARSSYYPVEISSCLHDIAKSNLKYVVIGLPCVIKGIRRAQRRMPRLKANIPVLLGLVCGQQRSKFFAEYLVRLAGQEMQSVRSISFREKRENQPASSSHFAVWTTESSSPAYVERSEGYGHAWAQDYFKQDACDYCDDVFAELADATFMDAWLPGFEREPRGTSIAMARSPLCQSILESGMQSGRLRIESIDIGDVIRSQQRVINLKRDSVALQLALNPSSALEFEPRVPPAPRWRIIARFRKSAENRRVTASWKALVAQRAAGHGLLTFNKSINQSTRTDTLLLNFLRLLRAPKRVAGITLRLGNSFASRFLSIRTAN